MNKAFLCGRLTRSPEFKDGEHPYSKFNLAVDRRKEGTDFINCVAFGKTAESLHKWVSRGNKILVEGHIQTGSYENRDGKKVYTFDVVVDSWEFAQSKGENQTNEDGFMKADDLDGDELPWNE